MSKRHALLLTDVVDSTRIAEAIGDAAMTAHWVAHDSAARDLLRTWRGREIERTDGLMAVFDSARMLPTSPSTTTARWSRWACRSRHAPVCMSDR